MITTFKIGQEMVAAGGATTTAFSDPLPLRGNDRATVIARADYLFGPSPSVSYAPEVSNDRVTWIDKGTTVALSGATLTDLEVFAVHGVFVRFRFQLSAGVGGLDAGASLAVHVKMDKIGACKRGCSCETCGGEPDQRSQGGFLPPTGPTTPIGGGGAGHSHDGRGPRGAGGLGSKRGT